MFTAEQRNRLLAHRAALAKRQEARSGLGQNLARFADFSGRYGIAAPGMSCVLRILPRWDYANRFLLQSGRWVPNPQYDDSVAGEVWIETATHWFDTPARQTQCVWCRKCLGEEELCPLCEASVALHQSSADQERRVGHNMRRRTLFLYNAVIYRGYLRDPQSGAQRPGELTYTADGKPNVRILRVPETVHRKILDIMLGGQEVDQSFARGEIFDVQKGYNLMVTRPAGTGTGEQYKVDCAITPTPLHAAGDARWTGWAKFLHNLPAEIAADKILSYDAMYELFYGALPENGESGEAVVSDTMDGLMGPTEMANGFVPPEDAAAAGDLGFGSAPGGSEPLLPPTEPATARGDTGDFSWPGEVGQSSPGEKPPVERKPPVQQPRPAASRMQASRTASAKRVPPPSRRGR
jgi:hypothetical protein